MGSANKKTNTTIKTSAALRVNRNRSTGARALDVVKKAKTVHPKPTKRWARHPEKSDVKGIDDGSKRAKARNSLVLKKHFGMLGLIGATVTNAVVAERDLEQRQNQRKNYVTKSGDPRKDLSDEDQWHLRQIEKHITKDRQVIRKKNKILPKVRKLQDRIRHVKTQVKVKGTASYEGEHLLPELEANLTKQLDRLRK